MMCIVLMCVQVVPHFKLPIFYLTDSILKNVRGPYPVLFGRIIVPLYCNCVKQVLHHHHNHYHIINYPCLNLFLILICL